MSFKIRNISVLAYAQGFTLWHHKAGADTLTEVSHLGYFDDARDLLAAGDMIMISAQDGGRVVVVSGTRGCVVTAPLC